MRRIWFLFILIFIGKVLANPVGMNEICSKLSTCNMLMFHDFEGDLADKSGNGSNGSFVGTGQILTEQLPLTQADNSYLNLSGGSYVNLTEGFTLTSAQNLTVMFWFRSSNLSSLMNVMTKTEEIAICVGGGMAVFRDNKGNGLTVSGLSLTINEWHFYTAVYDLATNIVRIYIDGILVKEGIEGTYNPSAGNDGFSIGSKDYPNGGCSNTSYIGDLDNVAVLGQALSQSEVVEIYSLDERAKTNIYTCSLNGAVYSSKTLCDTNCSSGICTNLGLSPSPSAGQCDYSKYEGFIYYNNKTYALTKSQGFWEDFSNTAIIPDSQTNNILKNLISSLGISSAWIGLYDPNNSVSYNSLDESRFAWRDASVVSFTNFNQGEPNNYLANEDIGVVPIPGEHWVHLNSDGTWNDVGYHVQYGGDYKPKFRALVEWNGALDCVNGVVRDTATTTNTLVDLYCGGNTPCYLCSDGSDVNQCNLGPIFGGSYDFISSKGSVQEIPLTFPLNSKVILGGYGVINYCSGTGECPSYNTEALLAYIVFKGDDGNYYWFGNPNNKIMMFNSSFNPIVLSYTLTSNGEIEFDVPSGVNFTAFSDYETYLGSSTSDNEININLTFYRNSSDWLCPISSNCTCPQNSIWNDSSKYCELTPNYSCSDSYYTLNGSICEATPQCISGSFVDIRKRCEASVNISCSTGFSLDVDNNVCYNNSPSCKAGYVWNSSTSRCEKNATLTCSYGTYNSSTLKCEYTPTCDIGTLDVDKCVMPVVTACSLGTVNTSTGRIEWNIGCGNGSYNASRDRCEWTPVCEGVGTYSTTDDTCYSDVIVSCPSGYTYDTSNNVCYSFDRTSPTPNCLTGTYNSSTGNCEVPLTVNCSINKSACINPDESYSCLNSGAGCTYTLQDGTTFNFDRNCSVSTVCGLLNIGESCSYNNGQSFTDCVLTNETPQVNCPSGFIADVNRKVCYSSNVTWTCPSGYYLENGVCKKQIFAEVIRDCSTGYDLIQKVDNSYACSSSPICNGGYLDSSLDICYNTIDCKGGSYDGQNDVCYSKEFFVCPDGFSLDINYFNQYGEYRCIKNPSCVYGGTISSLGVCQKVPENDCGVNILDIQKGVCYSAPICLNSKYNSLRNRCETTVLKTCNVGTLDSNLDVCYFNANCPGAGVFSQSTGKCEITSQLSCSSPFSLDSTGSVCQSNRICDGLSECNYLKACPDGMIYSATYGKCISDPVCSISGFTYDIDKRKCIGSKIGDYSCPPGYVLNGNFCEGPPITKSATVSGENAVKIIDLTGKTLLSAGTASYNRIDERFYICVNDRLILYSHNTGDFTYSYSNNVSCSTNPSTSNVYFYSNSDMPIDLGTSLYSPLIKIGTKNFHGGGSGSGSYTYTYCDGIGTYDPSTNICKVYKVPSYTFDDYVLVNNMEVGPDKYAPNYENSYGGVISTYSFNVDSMDYIEIYKNVSYACDDDNAYFYYSVSKDGTLIEEDTLRCPNGNWVRKILFASAGAVSVTLKYLNNSSYDIVTAGVKHFYPKYYCPSPSVEEPDGTCSDTPVCNSGTLTASVSGYCEDFQNVDVECPTDPSLPCIEDSDTGKLMCSPYTCENGENNSLLANTDTPTGTNDKQADGQVDENGNCLGTLYIFNGQDRRCRPPGTQTAFNDCCKDDSIELTGLVTIGKCNSDEVVLAGLKNSEDGLSQCHYVGEYCAEEWKWPGGKTCIQKKKTYCCFGSILSRIIQEQGRQQLGISWANPPSGEPAAKYPNCRGFTPEEFQNIDFGKIDFSEFQNSVKRKAVENLNTNTLTNDFKTHINNVFNQGN